MLPFSKEQFLAVFATYNLSIWPAQIVAYVVGVGLVVLLFWPSTRSGRLIAAGLALMWLWTGVAYHGAFFSTINTAAFGSGALFVTESVLLAYFGVVRSDLRFAPPADALGWLGATLVAYSSILYPLLGIWSGHAYPEMRHNALSGSALQLRNAASDDLPHIGVATDRPSGLVPDRRECRVRAFDRAGPTRRNY